MRYNISAIVAFNLANSTATTVNFAGAATTLTMAATSGTTTIRNNVDIDGDLNVDGGDLTTGATTFNLLDTTATTINFGGAATLVDIGSTTGTTTVYNNLVAEIDLAVKTIGISSDKKPNPNSFNINGTRFNKILEKDASTSVSKFYLQKAIKDFIDINIGMAKYYEPITLLDSLIQPKPSLATITRFEDTQLNYLEKEPKNFGEFWDPRYSINKIPKNDAL
jgi:hypothetical protein